VLILVDGLEGEGRFALLLACLGGAAVHLHGYCRDRPQRERRRKNANANWGAHPGAMNSTHPTAPRLTRKKWTAETGGKRLGENDELEYYTARRHQLSRGKTVNLGNQRPSWKNSLGPMAFSRELQPLPG